MDRVRQFEALSKREMSLLVETERLRDRCELLSHVSNALRLLYDRVVKRETDFLTDTVTSGLHTVFFDQNLSLKSDFQVSGGRVGIELSLSQEKEDGIVVEGDPLDSFGGGPVSIVSVLLRTVVLLKSGRVPFLFLDETVAPVSAEYLSHCAQFLRRLAETFGVDIFLVIHKPEYHSYAHLSYFGTEVSSEGGGTKLSVRRSSQP